MKLSSHLALGAFTMAAVLLHPSALLAQTGEVVDPFDAQPPPPPEPEAAPSTPTTPAEAPPEGVDAKLLAAWLRLDAALALADGNERAQAAALALQGLAALDDPRVVPLLLRMSASDVEGLRLSALGALGPFVDAPGVLERLQQAVGPTGAPAEAAVALPALLEAARTRPAARVPCPDGHTCGADEELLRALLAFVDAPTERRPAAVADVVRVRDARALPFLLRLASGDEPLRTPALDGLAELVDLGPARSLFLALLETGSKADVLRAIDALDQLADAETTHALLETRRRATDPDIRAALEPPLQRRAAADLAAIVAEEQRLAEEEANKPRAFDIGTRAAISAAAAAGAAAGGAAASSLVADQIATGSGACYGLWGACAGAGSAAALGWLGLGDARFSGSDVLLALSTSAIGAYGGLLIPPALTNDPMDARHRVYAGAGGYLVGLLGGSTAALFLHLKPEDVVEFDLTVLAANALAGGLVLSFPPQNDARPLWWTLLGATATGVGGGAAAAWLLDLDGQELAHVGVTSGIGLLAGLSTGGALAAAIDSQRSPTQVIGAGMLGAGLGMITGGALGQAHLTPTPGGMVYESWAALDAGMLGMGAGFLATTFMPEDHPEIWLGGAAIGLVGGAASAAFFPEGIRLDAGDYILQPLFVAFALYHSAALAATVAIDYRPVAAAGLIAPAAVSAGLVYGAPFLRTSLGDIAMVAGMMSLGAYFSAMGISSVAARDPWSVPSWVWVLGTSVGMDLGIAAGVGLDLLPWTDVGWKTTYVVAVAAGTTLVASLPGSLLAAAPGGIEVPDVMIASSVLGLGLGLATMPFIDFRVAPDWGLGKSLDDTETPAVSMTPTALWIPPLADESPPMAFGIAGRF